MKKLSILLIAFLLTLSASYAAGFGDSLKNAVKSDLNAVKDSVKQDIKNQADAKKEQRMEQTKAKQSEIIKERDNKINAINKDLRTKEKELQAIQNDKTMTQTEKTLKSKALERQINNLKNTKENTIKLYNLKLNSMK